YGLNTAQVQESKSRYGGNCLTEQETESFWDKFKDNLGDPMIKILCVALGINIVLVFLGQAEWYESAGIALAVLLAVGISTFSEHKNENAFQKLQAEASQILCKTYRNGEIGELPIDELVVGDCVLLQAGDKVPADGYILEGNIAVDQSVLNGETKEAPKRAAQSPNFALKAADFLNVHAVYRGSVVCSGSAIMQVTTVGDASVYGSIARELQLSTDRDTPLKVKLGKLAQDISKFGYIGGILIAVALLFQRIVMQNGFELDRIIAYSSQWMVLANDIVQAVMLAVIIIVMAVPEGLPLMIAIVSALNMGKMLKDNVLVRKVAGIETAGSLNILFSDKTGTITKGTLEAVAFVDGAGKEYSSHGTLGKGLAEWLSLSIHYNTGALLTGNKAIGGNATERAALHFAPDMYAGKGIDTACTIPFNSGNKYSCAQIAGERECVLIKGAPEKILARCRRYYDADGNAMPLIDRAAVNEKIDALAARAIRVLAFAISSGSLADEKLPEDEWILVGIMGIRDEIRPESITAIREVQQAGVQVVMITGDRKDTAVAIAKEAGLVTSEKDMVLTTEDLAELSDADLRTRLSDIRVIARALPSDKSRLVRVAQELDLVVGMTGDGVNDAPALKAADVGFAMGSGTEVSKEASEIIILDDNFSSIDKAILYGRTIFNNIRKFIIFQLTINVSAVLICFISPLLGMPTPLSIIQILWINLVMDTLAALAFGGEPALRRFMQEKPKKRTEHIVSKYMWTSIGTGSLYTFAASLFFLLSPVIRDRFSENKYLLTGYFTFFVFAAIFNALNARTEKLNLFDNITVNKGFSLVMAVIVLTQIVLTQFGGVVLHCYGLSIEQWFIALSLAFLIIPVDLCRKLFLGKQDRA
ncbi:calcium-translocating P-type ATPase, PMCA-type, partial [Desulfovibrio sp. OttesenSCG-928-A18]|nr:calcium-translocating P-type ATPase, PMCA-type [Desulfovibrio sp. OttesenSCG-928-A18]